MENLTVEQALQFMSAVGSEAADLVQVIAGSAFGAFLFGVFVVASLVRAVWNRVRHGSGGHW